MGICGWGFVLYVEGDGEGVLLEGWKELEVG